MFDSAINDDTPTWQENLCPGDIVYFAFPIRNARKGERPKHRPCLVLEVVHINGLPFAWLAFGTDVDNESNRGCEIVVRHYEEYSALGLAKATRFVAARRILAPLDHAFFKNAPDQSDPVLSRISGALKIRLDHIRAIIGQESRKYVKLVAPRASLDEPLVEFYQPRRRKQARRKVTASHLRCRRY